ncbi:MAG: hypothetical protein JW837_17515 [Sedimentisphaerales bacterium]|nr:hypothetical protein [Sedimentisphaerales bacterium]
MCRYIVYFASFALILSLMGTSLAQNIDPSLVGWWTFDEGSGSVAKDTSGESVDGTFFGDPSWGQDGDHRGVLLFDGTDDYVFIDGLFQVPVYTIALWFRVDNGSGQRDIFSAYAVGVKHGILLEMQTDGTLRYLHRYPLGTGGGTNIYTTTTYDDGAWYHAVMVKSANNIKLYINGEELGTAADSSVFNPGDAFGVALGCLDDERELARMFPGAMDDVRIYNRALSIEEIQAVMDLEPWPYAWGPTPADGSLHPDKWANLSWMPGYFANSHNVYLSDNYDDVNDGAENAFIGNQTATFLVAGFPGFAYPGGLIPGTRYYWRIDEVNDINPDSPWKGDIWSFLVPPKTAYEPTPADGAKFIDTNVEISWTSGFDAKLHTVYFGDNFDDVNNATGGIVQANAKYVPGTLEPGKTYYWRIDEFDVATTYKGDVWSFTTASEGGGLRAEYFQGVNLSNQVVSRIDSQIDFTWTEAPGEGLGLNNFSVRWTGEVEAAFTETYTFYTNSADGVRLWVNGRQLVNNWTDHESTENSGNIDLAAGQTYSLVMEYYERADAAVAELLWSSPHTPKQIVPQAALSLPVKASQARPSNGAVDVSQTLILGWGSGEATVSHDVYFGTDAEALKNADTSSPEYKGNRNLGSESYDPGKLEWNTTYYWRVDEIEDDGTVRKGNIWSFTTANFLIVDNMESYNDLDTDDPDSNRIFLAWVDGFDNPSINGSIVGYENPPFAEQTIVHNGNQSMPFAYDNTVGKSEATLTLNYPRDWTENGVDTLTIWYIGDAANTPETMYVVLNGSAGVDNDNPNSVLVDEWTEWNIALQIFADQGVNLVNVDTITLGFGNRSNPVAGGTGSVFFDDIRLYRAIP